MSLEPALAEVGDTLRGPVACRSMVARFARNYMYLGDLRPPGPLPAGRRPEGKGKGVNK